MAEVCPSPEELQYSGPVQCPVEGCEKELPSSACLRMHVARRHHGKLLERASGSRATTGCVSFFCPVKGCNRCREGGKSFSRLGQLKQHYQTMHGQKNYTCVHCGKKFALRDSCSRHQQECQQKIVCSTCGLDFRSRNALYQHAKRKGHTLPDGKKSLTSATKSHSIVLVPVPTSFKVVVPMPEKRRVVTNSTQTEESYTHEMSAHSAQVILSSPRVEVQSSSSQTTAEHCSFNHTHLLCSPSELLSLGTQTNFPPEAVSLVMSTQACQTQTAQLCDFGTQTHVDTTHAALSLDATSNSTTCTSNNASCYDDTSVLDLVEFGTQTACSESYSIGESDMVDFGTQTIGLSGLELDDPLFCSHLLPPECLDFGTQTLDFSYNPVSHCVQTYLHGNDTRDQSSQT